MSLRGSLILYAIAIVVFGSLALIPESWTSTGRPVGENITILAPWVTKSILWVSVIMAVILFIMAVLGDGYKRIRFPATAILLSIIGFPAAFIIHFGLNLGPWTMHGRIQTTSKDIFIFCDSHFLQGQMMALTHLKIESSFFTRLKVFGISFGDPPSSWALIIRPVGAKDEYGQLYLADDQILVGIRYDNLCCMTYDLKQHLFQGREEIKSLSPFVCLSADSKIHEPDVQRIHEFMRTTAPGLPGFPHRDTLQAGLQHPNPRVREIAKGLLELFDARSTPTGSAQDSQ